MIRTAFIKSYRPKRSKLRFTNSIFPGATLVLLALNFAYAQTPAAQAEYEKALALNKSANYIASAQILKSLMIAHPEIARYKSDYIAVASNAKLCTEVIALSNANYLRSSPEYVQEAIFSCYASSESFAKTQEIAKTILGKSGKNETIELKMVVLARNQKNSAAALYWSARFINDFPKNQSAWELRAGALQDIGDRYAALLMYEDINRYDPKDPGTQREIIQVLLDMGIPHLALYLIDQKSWNTTKDQKLRAMHNSGAQDLRWAVADSAVAPNRFISVDKGIQEQLKSGILAGRSDVNGRG